MKRYNKWLLAVLAAFIVVLAASALYFAQERRSIGIIGGADGPTAILITTT